MPKLVLKFNAAVIKEYPITQQTLTVGRKPDNDIVIDNPAVSSSHCKISLQGDTFYVEDLGSTNGTYLNDKRVMKAGLHHNDVVGMATKHALVFLEDVPPAAQAVQAPQPKQDATVVLSPESQQAMAKAAVTSAAVGEPEKMGTLQMLTGSVGSTEIVLTGLSTYIGKSDRAQVRIQGSGIFKSAPEMAASIHRRPEGYVLIAIKNGYPSVNGTSVSGQTLLKDGDLIRCGATTMQFSLKEKKS